MNRANLLRLALLALIWGASFLLIALALDGLSPAQIVLTRLVSGAAVLVGIVLARRLQLPRSPVLWAHLGLMGLFANAVPNLLFAWAQERITSGLAGVLNATTPLFTLVLATTFLPSERLSPLRAAGLLLGFLGVVIVIGPWDSDPLTSSIPGQLACLGAACCYGIAFVYTRRFITGRHARPEALAAGQLMAAAAILLAAAPFVATDPVRLDPVVVGSVLTLGLVATGLAYVLYYRLITEAGATSAAMVTYLIPVVAVTLGYLVLDEPVGWNLFAGAAVVILGVAMAEGRLTLRSAGSAARARSASPRRPSADPRRRSGPGG